jgi:hypothetical protein
VSSTSAAGASNETRPFVPMTVSPRWMPRPMPNGPASASSRSISATGSIATPSSDDGTPCVKPIVWRSGARGFVNASFDSTQACSGMLSCEVSVSLPPIVTPHRPRFTEYAAPYGGIGSFRSSRNASCSGRLKARSRTGARISMPGASVRIATSKRTWSLPAAVQPCAIVDEPSFLAISAATCACSTRSAPTQNGYRFPRRALPISRYFSTLSKYSAFAGTR